MRTIDFAMVAAWAVALSVGGAAQAQAPADNRSDPTLREYRAKLPLLVERYSTNRKIRYRITRYVSEPAPGQRAGDVALTAVNELITDGQQIKVVTLESKPEHPEVAKFWRPDMRFDISKKGGAFKITEQHSASSNYYSHELLKYNLFAHEPLRAGGNSVGTPSFFDTRARSNSIAVTINEVKRSTWKGRPCLEVRSRWDNNHGTVEVAGTYLDLDHDSITVATETDSKTAPDGKKPYQRVEEIEYQPSAEGFPLPKSSRRYLRFDDGTTRTVWEVEYLSYERYTPAAEEFQLEKAYGLTTPAGVPAESNPALVRPPERRWWPWAAVAAGVVLVVVAVFFFRRGRSRGVPIPVAAK